MNKSTLICLILAVSVFFIPLFSFAIAPDSEIPINSAALSFIENKGQVNSEVSYYSRMPMGTLFVTRTGQQVSLFHLPGSKSMLAVHEKFIGAENTSPIGVSPGNTRINRYIGSDPRAWQENIPNWQMVGIDNIYPGVDFRLRALPSSIEKIFIVKPGSDPSLISLEVAGIEKLSLGEDGSLKLHSPEGEVEYSPPIAYQKIDGKQMAVDIKYKLMVNRYGFALGTYDEEHPLYIDPLVRTSFYGGNSMDSGHGVAVDKDSGSVYITGYTSSDDLPTTAGVFKEAKTDFQDIYIAKFDADLTTLEAATFYGTSGWEYGVAAIAYHPDGSVYVTGKTQGTDLPGADTGYQSTYTGGSNGDAFIARLNGDLTGPPKATYFGGSGEEVGISIAINGIPSHDLYGSVYIAGRTSSGDLPGTTGGFQENPQSSTSSRDVFVACFDSTLQTLRQATYFGGSGWDEPSTDTRGQALMIHPDSGAVLFVGFTSSSTIPSLLLTRSGTTYDAFFASLYPGLDGANTGTYIGGSNEDMASAIAVIQRSGDSGPDTYVIGRTKSEGGIINPDHSGYQTSYQGGNFDAFIVGLSNAEIVASTYLGGEFDDRGYGITVDPVSERVWVTGETNSGGFPTSVDAEQGANAGYIDAFVASLSLDLTQLKYSSYLGGEDSDFGVSMTLNPSTGNIYAVGNTSSQGFYGTDGQSYDNTYNDGGDAFVALFEGGTAVIPKEDILIDFGPGTGVWAKYNDAIWAKIHDVSPELMAVGDLDGNGQEDCIMDFGANFGLYVLYNNTTWTKIHDISPELIAVGDLDGNGQEDCIIYFGADTGIWVRYNNATWEKLHGLSPKIIETGDLDGNGRDDCIVDFGNGVGIWVFYNNTTWMKLHGLSSEIIAIGDGDGNGQDDCAIDFGSGIGIWVWGNNSVWIKLHDLSSEIISGGDLNGNGKDEVIIDFGPGAGVWILYNSTEWTQLHSLSPEIIETGDLDGNGQDDIIIDFGDSYGIYVWYNATTWSKLNSLSSEIIKAGNIDNQ